MKKWYRMAKILEDGSLQIIENKSNWFEVEPDEQTVYEFAEYLVGTTEDVAIVTVWSRSE